MRRTKGGIVVDLLGIDAFLPGSQIDVRPVRDFDAFIGKEMDFRVVKVNHPSENVVVSHKVLVEAELAGQRKTILESLEKGQILEGHAKAITDFGVFVDLGGVDGLVHITDLSWGRISHPSEVVKLDQTVNVVVLDFDQEKKRISLGMKQLLPHPWENIELKYPVSTKVQGKVVSLTDYGAFVEIEKGIEGLIHI
jgi:small subunit ribosomal protein S1